MIGRVGRLVLLLFLFFLPFISFAQQDVDFHINAHLLSGKKILKVKRDFFDPYLWVLAQNNEVYRINSVTQVIDDYTATFSAYSNLQFIDIAGRSKDTVFIATNSTNVIQYKKGSMRLIGIADGISNTVNSIGIEKRNGVGQDPYLLMIASDKGFYEYDTNSDKTVTLVNDGVSKIYEATYRRQIYKDSTASFSGYTGDTVQYLPVVTKGEFPSFVADAWEGGKEFGYNVNAAFVATASMYQYDVLVDYTNLFWGNSKGMFQNNANRSYTSVFPHAHYLAGINVNKITSIYGLVAFGNGGFFGDPRGIRENLLVGTDNGLYFSASFYNNFDGVNGISNGLRKITLFHFDDLGNIPINDICVNPSSTSIPVCEDGVWVATNGGLYYIKPDYGKYTNLKLYSPINFKGQSPDVKEIKSCQGGDVSAVVNLNLSNTIIIQWYKDGQILQGENKPNLKIISTGEYYIVLNDPCADEHVESNHLKVTITTTPDFSFNYPDRIQQCDNSPLPLQTELNPGYQYRWYTNGVLNGETSEKFTVTKSGKYKVEVSACTNSWVPSKEVEVDMVILPIPQITAAKAVYCAEDVAKLAVNVPVDATYTINWYLNGNLLRADNDQTAINVTTAGNYSVIINSKIAGCSQPSQFYKVAFIPAPFITSPFPNELRSCSSVPLNVKFSGKKAINYRWYTNGVLNGNTAAGFIADKTGKYKVEASSCEGSWVSSNEIQIDIVQLPMPVINADKQAYCIGDNAKLSIITPPNPSYTINWLKDNVPVSANKNLSTLTTNIAGNYTVSIINNDANSDGTFCSQKSVAQSLSFNPPPVVSIEKIVKTALCDGQTVDLKATYVGGTIKWSTGEISDKIGVTTAGTYKATVTTPAGCQADASVDVTFLPNPVFSLKDTTICTYKQQTIILTGPTGFTAYSWNGQTGTQTYRVTTPQTVNLTVTDANGCQATKTVKVTDQCPAVWIPNTFTPNNDGINDTWIIEGLTSDQSVSVKVYNRYGNLVYESKGYGTAWNGEYRGKKLPTGTYYYIISTQNGKQNFNGYITIIY